MMDFLLTRYKYLSVKMSINLDVKVRLTSCNASVAQLAIMIAIRFRNGVASMLFVIT